ncbi:hypothetical protein [Micromonospora sp. NPDC092111]|uniref:hypothetical protein n=1 Tax=Micromonospora sp. NPDC092111 TaxID=3364289 RepID=UPI0038165A9A
MAFRTWGRLLLTALAVSVLAGAGQLGIAYGFGIVRLTGEFADVNRWPAQLAWVGWFAVTAAVAGAVVAGRLARREGLPEHTSVQLAISGAAALGAIVVAPLCMQPARAAELSTIDPVWAVGICAVAGAVVGAGAASAVLLRPPLGWNVAMLAGAVWLTALVSVAPGVLSTGPLRTVRLGVLEPSWLDADAAQRLAMLLLPVVALLAGAVTGGLARRRGHVPLVGGAAGAAGPVLLAFAYLTAGPGDPVDRYQLAPYYGAVIAVAAGTLGSAATTLLRWPLLPARRAADGAAIEPTDILAPLPVVPTPAAATPAAATSDAATSDAATSDEPSTVDLTAAARTVGSDRTDATIPSAASARDDHRPAAAPMAGVRPDLGRSSADAPGTGRTPAHWDWPDAPVPAADQPVARSSAPDGATAEARPLAPVEGNAAPDTAGPEPRLGPAGEPAGRAAPPGPTGATGPTSTEVIPAEATGAEQPETVGPVAGGGPVSPPKPRATRTRRARPADLDAPAVPTGRPDPDSPVGASSTAAPSRTAGKPATAGPAPTSADTGPTAPDPGSSQSGAADPGSADPPVGVTGTAEPAAGLRHIAPGGVEGTASTSASPPGSRPRHQLPDLSGTGGWVGTPHPVPARTPLPFPEPETTERTSAPGPVSLRWEAADTSAAPVDGPPADPAPIDSGEQKPAGKARSRRGLFRRSRSAEGEPAAEPTTELATPDEEYVDWVAGLSKPVADNEPERESGRRSLRSSGRHHRD